MSKWNCTVNIKPALSSYDSGEPLGNISTKIKDLFTLQGVVGDDVLRLIFHSMDEASSENNVEYFDDALNDLYDWADEHRVWLGL